MWFVFFLILISLYSPQSPLPAQPLLGALPSAAKNWLCMNWGCYYAARLAACPPARNLPRKLSVLHGFLWTWYDFSWKLLLLLPFGFVLSSESVSVQICFHRLILVNTRPDSVPQTNTRPDSAPGSVSPTNFLPVSTLSSLSRPLILERTQSDIRRNVIFNHHTEPCWRVVTRTSIKKYLYLLPGGSSRWVGFM